MAGSTVLVNAWWGVVVVTSRFAASVAKGALLVHCRHGLLPRAGAFQVVIIVVFM